MCPIRCATKTSVETRFASDGAHEGDKTAKLGNALFISFGTLGALFIAFLALMWWGSRIPKRPSVISPSGIFIERGSVPFKLSTHGDWLDCWQDLSTRMDHCRLTDEKGGLKFEDTFLPYKTEVSIPGPELKIDVNKTGHLWMGVTAEKVSLPIIFLQNGEILLPKSEYEKAKKVVEFWVYGRDSR